MKIVRALRDIIQFRIFGGGIFLAYLNNIKTDITTVMRRRVSWQKIENEWPKNMNIEVTNICNANCIFCAYQYQEKYRTGSGFVSEAHFYNCVDIHAKNGGRFVSLAPMIGEPLLDKTLNDKIRYIRSKGLDVSFFTNGTRLKYINVQDFLETKVKLITLSTAPFSKKLFEAIYRSERYEEMLEGVIKLLKCRNEMKSNFVLAIDFRSNLTHKETLGMPDFQNQIWPLLTQEERKLIEVKNLFDSWGGQIKKSDLPPGMTLKPPNWIKNRPCKWTFIPMICWDGKVRACACRFRGDEKIMGDDLVVGDLASNNLEEIWRGPRVNALHDRFVSGNPPRVCRDCSVYNPI